MASTETLTSLAMLKVSIDQGKDYLDYLRPFILQVLIDHEPDPVTDQVVCDHIRTQFGLEIPARTVQIVLKRLSRQHPLKRELGVYHIEGPLGNTGIANEKAKAARHIQAVVSGLLEFALDGRELITTTDEAIDAICGFLSEFSIPCLRAYLRGTTIPTVAGKQQSHIVLVSEYVLHLQRTDPERFESFIIMLQGHMLANALLSPDLHRAPKTYNGVTFYLDTPLLVQRLGLEGEPKKRAIEELIALLRRLGGTVATFSHSHDELRHVLTGAANFVELASGRGGIVMEARRSGTTKSDLLLLAGQIDQLLPDARIEIKSTPLYIWEFQIDETTFETSLADEIFYFNPRAIQYDINSVRSIYVLRTKTAPASVEKCKAVLVSSNAAFARAAWDYGMRHEESREVSTVVTDFSLANMAWLKAPMGAPSLPTTELLAYAYAALQPSRHLLDKYLAEIDKLQKQGNISERDHQLLRSSTIAHEELMRLTLGDEAALTSETVTETLRRVESEIKKEESDKLKAEQDAHHQTQQELLSARAERQVIQQRLYWRCRRRAKRYAWAVSVLAAVLLFLGLAAGLGLKPNNPILGWVFTIGSLVLIFLTLGNLLWGTTVKRIHQHVTDRCVTWFLRQEAKTTGISPGHE